LQGFAARAVSAVPAIAAEKIVLGVPQAVGSLLLIARPTRALSGLVEKPGNALDRPALFQ
jgi:hypothetical protein